jgi:glycosyltransferase involved in cell wall biosynthesis
VKVVCLIDSLSPGGAEMSLAALAPEYRSRGIDLEVAYLKERPGLHERFTDAGARLTSLGDCNGRIEWARAARRLIAQRKPDLVHTTLFESDVAGRFGAWSAHVPAVSSLVNVEYGPEQFSDPRLSGIRLRGAQFVNQVTGKSVVRWHAITRHVADVMAGRLRIPAERIDVIPRGRDPRRLGMRTHERRERVRRSLGVQDGTKLIVAAARQEHQKGLDVLLDALPQIVAREPDVRLLIAGRTGNQTPRLREMLDRGGLDGVVQLLGVRDDVPDLLCAADAFAFPSRFEGLGSVLLEAMALEAPIVASELPPVVETVRPNVDALVVPSGSPDALASALIETLHGPDAAGKRATAARRRFLQHYTVGAVADAMVAFYERALSGRLHRRRLDRATTGHSESPVA